MPSVNHIPVTSRWFILGSILALAATISYFGSDDWSHTARRWGESLSWIFYGAGLLVWLWYFTRPSGRYIPIAMGVLLGLGGLAATRSNFISDRSAYLWTHPYAFWSNLINPPLFLEHRALRNWAMFTLEPYLLLLELTVGMLLLILIAVRGSRQLFCRLANVVTPK